MKFSRVNIYARDGHRCQYCGATCAIDELTYDHVVPRSKGGLTTWENIVSVLRVQSPQGESHAGGVRHAAARDAGAPDLDALGPDPGEQSLGPDAWRDYVYWTAEIDYVEGGSDSAAATSSSSCRFRTS